MFLLTKMQFTVYIISNEWTSSITHFPKTDLRATKVNVRVFFTKWGDRLYFFLSRQLLLCVFVSFDKKRMYTS